MQVIFELSGEHPTLPVAEIRAIFEGEGIKHKEIHHNRIYIAEVEGNLERIAERIAMSFSIGNLIAEGSEEEMMEAIKKMKMHGDFKIEVKKLDKIYSSTPIKKKFGEELKKAGYKVNLKKPVNIIKIFSGKKFYLSRQIYEINRHRFEKRKEKPFELPITMHPRLARAITNLARIKKGSIVADPFCGTGSILIESSLIGAKIIGIEAKEWIAEGCIRNMEYFRIKNYKIYSNDMRSVDLNADAVVTDFPYGRASYLSDEMKKLYKEAFKKIHDWIGYNKYAVIGMANKEMIKVGKKYFELVEIHPYRVHKSLTRFFCVFRKE